MKKYVVGFVAAIALTASLAWATTFNLFNPATGVLVGNANTYVTTAATATGNLIPLWSGTCSTTTYLRGDGTCATPPGTGGGTVNSVSLTAPSVFSVAGSPVTSTGTLAVTFATGQTQNQVLASPNGSSGAVGLRALVAADLPSLAANPSGLIGLTAANGVATTYTRSDATHAIDQSIAPTWTGTHAFSNAVHGNNTTNSFIARTGGQTLLTAAFAANGVVTGSADYGFADFSTVTYASSAGDGHASFDAAIDMTGSFNNSHHHDFQGWSHFDGTGTIDDWTNFWANPLVDSGTITNLAAFKFIGISGTATGHIGTAYGLWIQDFNGVATTSWAIKTDGLAPSSLGGALAVTGTLVGSSHIQANGTTITSTATSAFDIGTTGGFPDEVWTYSGGATDTKVWDMYSDGANLNGRAINDAHSGATTWLTVNRTGTVVNSINLQATAVQVNGVNIASITQTSATFTGTLTGMSGATTCSMKYRKTGSSITIFNVGGQCTGTSNSTSMTMTGLPAAVQPSQAVTGLAIFVINNNVPIYAAFDIASAGSTITFSPTSSATASPYLTSASTNFTNTGTKGIVGAFQIVYDLAN